MTTTINRPIKHEEVVDHGPAARVMAIVVACCLAALIVFQIVLAAGAPLGRAAWGGDHTTLPTSLRLATMVPIAIYALGGLLVLRRAGYRIPGLSQAVSRRGAWMFGVLLVLSALTNCASQSDWERFLMAPIALGLGVLTLAVAGSAATNR